MGQMSRWPNLDILFTTITASRFLIPFTFFFKMVVMFLSCPLRLEGIGFRVVYHIFVAALLADSENGNVT
jgi:hypothetical protein